MNRVLLISGLLPFMAFAASAQERVALLIRNSSYRLADLSLPNPANDARTLGV